MVQEKYPAGNTGKGTAQEDDQGWLEFRRARILIKIDEGRPPVATKVSERCSAPSGGTEEGLDEVLMVNRQKVDERVEAHLIAARCPRS